MEKIKLLILEDNSDDFFLLKESLESSERINAEMYHCSRLNEAIDLAQKKRIDAAVIDLNLPDSFGLETYKIFGNKYPDIPVVVMTGQNDPEMAFKAVKNGAQDYIFKGERRSGRLDRTLLYAIERHRLLTELKASAETIQRLNLAVEQSPVSIVITDPKGQIEYVNDKFRQMTGYSKAEVFGKNPRILQSGTVSPEIYEELWKTILSGKSWRGELCNKRKNGELYWEDALISPVVNDKGDITDFIAIKEDITDKKALKQLKRDMEHMMRHDLKGPLTGIINLPELMKMKGGLNEEQKELADLIGEAGHTMIEMIDSSLDMLKMEKNEFNYRPETVDLTKIILTLVQENDLKLSQKSLTCQIFMNDLEITKNKVIKILSDKQLIYRMLSNLFLNAVEASPENGVISIRIQDREFVTIAIGNSGTVPEHIRSDFFGKYITSGKKNGTGLGTYSAKLMADVMHYTIKMETSDEQNETYINIKIPKEVSDQN
ncbi:MAG: PAS domain S-box protein [Desulfobacterales bacterium]|nr:PAS domain S-box protein [Desulfobacterales bacterium]